MTEEEIAAFKKCKPGEAVEVTLPIILYDPSIPSLSGEEWEFVLRGYGLRRTITIEELLEEFPMPEKTDAERLVEGWWESLKAMTDEQRLDVLRALKEHFCEHCGTTHLPCSCWNDE